MSEAKINLSIHPRNWPASHCPGTKKSNTAKPAKSGRLSKGEQRRLERRRAMSATHENVKRRTSSTNIEGAYRMPGSLKRKRG